MLVLDCGALIVDAAHLSRDLAGRSRPATLRRASVAAWPHRRIAVLAVLPREFNGKRLVTHQRDAIRLTMYAIGKRKGRREEH